MFKNATQLKAKVRNAAQQAGIPAQALLQIYFMERLLARIAASEYCDAFVLKGGVLVAALLGIGQRSTMDLDTTLRGIRLERETVEAVFAQVLTTSIDDGVAFEFRGVTPIRKNDVYGGLRISLTAHMQDIAVPLKVDVTTGDVLTPDAVGFAYCPLFGSDEETMRVMSYNLETLLAEKFDAIMVRSTANTRARDFYDLHTLWRTRRDSIQREVLIEAIHNTAKYRGTLAFIEQRAETLSLLETDASMSRLWLEYQHNFAYARDILWSAVLETVREFVELSLEEDGEGKKK